MKSIIRKLLGRKQSQDHGKSADTPLVGKRILVFTEHFNATYYISFDRPLKALHAAGQVSFRAYDQMTVTQSGKESWKGWISDFRPHIVFFTRYGQPEGIDIIRHCRDMNIPVVYHIDDDLLNLPASLGAEIVKRQGAAAQIRRKMMHECDLIYASTAVLAERLKTQIPGKRIFSGIYASFLDMAEDNKLSKANRKIIGYMGSKGHKEDLALVVPELVRLMQERPDIHFETFGTIEMPTELAQFHDRVRHHTVNKDYYGFMEKMASLGWSIGLAPLVNEPFNQCKAPTKFIEYTSCSIPVVASDMVVYAPIVPSGGGLLVGREGWKPAIERLLDEPNLAQAIVEKARAHCGHVFSLKLLATQVLDVCEQVRAIQKADCAA